MTTVTIVRPGENGADGQQTRTVWTFGFRLNGEVVAECEQQFRWAKRLKWRTALRSTRDYADACMRWPSLVPDDERFPLPADVREEALKRLSKMAVATHAADAQEYQGGAGYACEECRRTDKVFCDACTAAMAAFEVAL